MYDNEELLILIGKNLRALRIKKQLSQQELSDITDIAKSTIQRIESGKMNPTIIMLNKISQTLGFEILDLLNYVLVNQEMIEEN